MKRTVHWQAGDETLRGPLEAAIAGRHPSRILAENARRCVSLVAIPSHSDPAGAVALKHFRPRRASGPLQPAKRLVGQTAANREWRALGALAAAGIGAPKPRAWLRRGHEEWLAMEFIAGQPFREVLLAADPVQRRELIEQLGSLVRQLHGTGIAHGDLHLGNVLYRESGGPVLIDWQRARLRNTVGLQARDLAALEFSFARNALGRSDRLRLRRSVLGPRQPHDSLRAAGQRTDAFARDHYRGRTRRCRNEGGGQTSFDEPLGRGMRIRDFAAEAVREAVAAHDAALRAGGTAVLKSDDRARVTRVSVAGHTLIAKEVTKSGLGRRLADPFRGSAARRGWIGGHGLRARRIGVALPVAWIDRRDHRGHSVLLMEDLGGQPCLELAPREQIDPDAILRLLLALHRRGVDHGDLQASHIFGRSEPRLIDLEGVRFPRRVSDDARLRALAELNASLPDASLPADERRELFRCYAAALPFRIPVERALREVIGRSLARQHAWRGLGCALATEEVSPRTP